MTIAVIKTGGKEYKVSEGDEIIVEKLTKNLKEKIEFPDLLAGKKVTALVLEHGKGKKVRVFKFKRKTGYKKLQGHRQKYTKLKIESIK